MLDAGRGLLAYHTGLISATWQPGAQRPSSEVKKSEPEDKVPNSVQAQLKATRITQPW